MRPPTMKQRRQQKTPLMKAEEERLRGEEEAEEEEVLRVEVDSSDICTALLKRYQKSSAPQHRHLCASAAAIRSILLDEGLPLTPPAYFAAAISSIQNSPSLDPDAASALSSFLSVLLPLVPRQSLPPHKANDAAAVLAQLLCGLPPETVSAATLRSLVKSLGFVLPLCSVDDWDTVELPLKMLLEFSVDRRPKVRRCAQVCIEKVFMSFESTVRKRASKMVWSLFNRNMPLAIELSAIRIVDGSKSELLSQPKHLEVLHMLNSLKLLFPFLSKKVTIKLLPDLYKLLGCHFSPLTRHILDILGVLFEFSRVDIPVSEVDNIIVSLVSYVSCGGKNPVDTVMSASALLKSGLDKLHEVEQSAWIRNLPLVFSSVAGLLQSEANTPTQAVEILKEMIKHHIDSIVFLASANQLNNGGIMGSPESTTMESICDVFVNMVSAFGGIPNEHTLAVISDLFLKLGGFSYLFMKDIVLKLADQVMVVGEDKPDMKHVEECIGSAIIAMGPEKILSLLPITFHVKKLNCSNIWLIPIFKKYVVGASLEFFLEHIVPLARSIQKACSGVKRSPLIRNLQNCAHDLFDLLPAFCRYPIDTAHTFESLVKLLVVLLKDSSMHETVSSALQELVNQNKAIVRANQDAKESPNKLSVLIMKDAYTESGSVPSHYSKKIASRNIRAIASSSMDLLQALIDAFFNSPSEKRAHLKEAIGCLASITERSNVKNLFLSLVEKFNSMNSPAELEKLESNIQTSIDVEQGRTTKEHEKDEIHRCLMIELASSLVEGADEDFINIVFDYIRPSLQANGEIGQSEAYYTLSKIFKEHSWFHSARFDELMDLLLGLKSPVDVMLLRRRFTCFHFLLVHLLESDMGKTHAKAFLILNEIILTLKDIIGYLSGASPHIMSGAVAALSLLIYKDPSLCFTAPDLMPSVLILLKSKANEVIKAVLGFMKVLVSCLHTKDLQEILSDIVNGVIPWSSVSKHHFRSKVRIILEIVTRKCGFNSVELVTPEKYKGFIKTIAQQWKNKTSSIGAGDSDEALKLAESMPKGRQKRMREESAIPREKTSSGASGTTRKEKGWKKLKTSVSSTKERSKGTRNRTDSQWRNKTERSYSEKRNIRRDFDEKLQSEDKGMNRQWRKDGKRDKNKATSFKATASSKSHKHRRVTVKPHQRVR
ncbi:uncharacterized protein LOC131231204 isoform X2 [Magnolia sinica]|uniref:uncharacterized protein LOC131231204 isoform X2 n=1 Tax=Magnolia sinica TaxID=86752 RepID=UPI00265B33FC|nr:uncharacterized protein LOC131231204 isoform X2 [Magnolia sinica]